MNEADVVVKERILQQRLAPTPMEPRGVLAEYSKPDKTHDDLDVEPEPALHPAVRRRARWACPRTRIRVISPDVGGGFGSKISPYPEDYLVPAAAKLSGRPVKWIETRTESLQTTTHGRGQVFDVEAGAKKDGTLVCAQGHPVPRHRRLRRHVRRVPGVRLPAGGRRLQLEARLRAHGRRADQPGPDRPLSRRRPARGDPPLRADDRPARRRAEDGPGRDPAEELHQREFPYTNNFGLVYDSGDYEKALDKALEIAGYDKLRKRAGGSAARRAGTSASASRPGSRSAASARARPPRPRPAAWRWSRSAQVRVLPTGSVARLRRHPLPRPGPRHDVPADRRRHPRACPTTSIEIRHGDTAEGPAFGYGTYGSRSLAVGGMAVHKASKKVVDKATQARRAPLRGGRGRHRLRPGPVLRQGQPGQAQGDRRGRVRVVRRQPARGHGARPRGRRLLRPAQLRLAIRHPHRRGRGRSRDRRASTCSSYIAVDDCGNIINPMIVDGQLHGGIAQGIAQALFEEVVYDDETGQLKTGTLTDYLVPTANEFPNFELDRTVTPSPDQRARRQGHRRGRHDRQLHRGHQRHLRRAVRRSASSTSTCRPARIGSGS